MKSTSGRSPKKAAAPCQASYRVAPEVTRRDRPWWPCGGALEAGGGWRVSMRHAPLAATSDDGAGDGRFSHAFRASLGRAFAARAPGKKECASSTGSPGRRRRSSRRSSTGRRVDGSTGGSSVRRRHVGCSSRADLRPGDSPARSAWSPAGRLDP